MLGRVWIGIVELQPRLQDVAFARHGWVIGVVHDVTHPREALPSAHLAQQAGGSDASFKGQMLELVTKTQFRESVECDSEVQSATCVMLAVRCDSVVIEIEIERLRITKQSRRDKEMAEQVQRVVI